MEPMGIYSSSSSSPSSDGVPNKEVELTEIASKQLALNNPGSNEARESQLVSDSDSNSDLIQFQPRVLTPVGAFTVQCAKCFKWRLMPTKEKYEEIREHIIQTPFYCETARGWRPNISCDDKTDVSQDGTTIWAADKPSIAKPPPGWKRLVQIRGTGSKFADVYYQPPTGKRLRSMVDVRRYLMEQPEYMAQGVTLSQFSFKVPKPCATNPSDEQLRKKARKTPKKPIVM